VTLRIAPAPGGVTFAVKAVPGASRDRIAGVHGDALWVTVTAPPERGRANAAIAALLAAALAVPARAVTVVAGGTWARKTVVVTGIDAATVRQRLGLP
jgi:uncharacterized protein YggU (UPF0235/DUF167 family)